MCGIAGIIARGGQRLPASWLETALARLAHRGPDGAATANHPNWAFGHCRLAIFDPDERANQPFRYGPLTLVFNGAIYNFIELRRALEQAGYAFSTRSDTEVIAAAYLTWGTSCVERFNGMWALALHDATTQTIFCSRDRYGIKPFYYLERPAHFAFASEVKALLALPGEQPAYQAARLREFLISGWLDHTSDTLFAGIHQLPAGHNLLYSLPAGQFRLESYYTPGQQPRLSTSDLSRAEAVAGVRRWLAASIDVRLRSDMPLTLTLSGGVDSSSLAGLIAQRIPHFPVFSVAFTAAPYDERSYMQAAVTRFGLNAHYQLPTFADFQAYLDPTLYQQEVPLASAAVVAHHLLMRSIRAAGYKVVLSGQGADEVLAGYHKFYGPWLRQLYQQSAGLALQAGWEIFQRQPTYFLQHAERIRQFLAPARARPAWLHPQLWQQAEAEAFRRSADDTIRDCSLNLLREIGLPILLHHEDRNAMAFGIESRLPFLDYRLVDYCLSLPDAYKLESGRRKSLLLDAMQDILPLPIQQRRDKLGFASPQREWMDQARATIFSDIGSLPLEWPALFKPQVYDWARAVMESRAYSDYPTVWRIWMTGRWLRTFF